MYTKVDKLVSAIKNHVDSGLRGFYTNNSLSPELIADEVIRERLLTIKEHALKGTLPLRDLYISINCINVDCDNIEKCRCRNTGEETPNLHFEIPQLVHEYGLKSIDYIGSTDKLNSFLYYFSIPSFKNHKYRKRGKNKPYIWIDTTPNENGMLDCWVFNAPLLKSVSIVGIFKDTRQLENFSCCADQQSENLSFIDTEVVNRLSLRYLYYYRTASTRTAPNDQTYLAG